MKILIIRPTPNVVNLNTYNLQEIGLAKALVRKGHQCDVMYCSKEKDHIQTLHFDDGRFLNILWLHGFGAFYEGIFPSLKKYVDQYDIIQVGGYICLTSWWLGVHMQNKTVNYQGNYRFEKNRGDIIKEKVFDHILLPMINKDNMVVVTKNVLATNHIKKKGITNVTTAGVGLDLSNLSMAEELSVQNELISQIKDSEGVKYLLYVGVLEPRRNILFILNVFKKVNEQISNTKLVIIGKGKEDYVNKCKLEAKRLGIAEKIIYNEMMEQKLLPIVYQHCDVFLLPTRYEVFGMVLLEAMYYGLPVFTTYNGGSSTLMNEENGIIINDLDSNVWSEEIAKVLKDNERYLSIGKAAHKTIAEDYTWDALANKFIDVYNLRLYG